MTKRRYVYRVRLSQRDWRGQLWAGGEYHVRAASLSAAIERAVGIFRKKESTLKNRRIEALFAEKVCELSDEA